MSPDGMAVNVRATVIGFLGAFVVLVALTWVVGLGALLDSLQQADPRGVATVVVMAAVWVAAWAFALRTILRSLGAGVSPQRAVWIYLGVLFANNVTPFGQAGGEPISAVLIADNSGTEYETALAAIASADTLNLVPSTLLALIGIGYMSLIVAAGRQIREATVAVLSLAFALLVVGYLAWRFRTRLEDAVTRVSVVIVRTVGGYLPVVTTPSSTAVRTRVDGFFRGIERVAADRRALPVALGFSALGWLAQATALWLALYAVGVIAPYPVVLIAVPLGAVAGIMPLPGGLGGIEAVLVGVLVPLVGISAATAGAAVVLHRGAIYWLPTILGGSVMSVFGAHRV